MGDSIEQIKVAESGVTIAELLVVIVVIGVITGFALLQRGGANEQFKRQNVARELKSALERARFDSVKRRADDVDIPQARVVINETSFVLTTDKDQNGVLEAADDQTTDFSGQDIVIGLKPGLSFPVTVTYSHRGESSASDPATNTSPQFWVCNVSCSTPSASNSNLILVTPTGTVNMLAGGVSPPTFDPHSGITNVSASNSINNTAAVTPTPGP